MFEQLYFVLQTAESDIPIKSSVPSICWSRSLLAFWAIRLSSTLFVLFTGLGQRCSPPDLLFHNINVFHWEDHGLESIWLIREPCRSEIRHKRLRNRVALRTVVLLVAGAQKAGVEWSVLLSGRPPHHSSHRGPRPSLSLPSWAVKSDSFGDAVFSAIGWDLGIFRGEGCGSSGVGWLLLRRA